jgi:TolA-binding protein
MKTLISIISVLCFIGCATPEQVTKQSDRIDELQKEISYLHGKIDELNTSIQNLNSNLSNSQTQPKIAPTQNNSASDNSQESGQCQAITKKGTQCSRKAQAGSKFCWQHQGSTTTIDKSSSTDTNTEIKSNSSAGDGTIHTGPRGGQYRISASGKKVYIRKK